MKAKAHIEINRVTITFPDDSEIQDIVITHMHSIKFILAAWFTEMYSQIEIFPVDVEGDAFNVELYREEIRKLEPSPKEVRLELPRDLPVNLKGVLKK